MVELADTLDSGSSALTGVEVRILSGAPITLEINSVLVSLLSDEICLSDSPRITGSNNLEVIS